MTKLSSAFLIAIYLLFFGVIIGNAIKHKTIEDKIEISRKEITAAINQKIENKQYILAIQPVEKTLKDSFRKFQIWENPDNTLSLRYGETWLCTLVYSHQNEHANVYTTD